MTTIIESNANKQYCVRLGIEVRHNREIYIVQACPCFDDSRCGYPEKELTYPIIERRKAYAAYKRYIKKYCN